MNASVEANSPNQLPYAGWAGFKLALILSALALAACDNKAAAPTAPAAQPAPSVKVVVAKAQTVPLTTELPGRTSAYLVAEVRPQVTGLIKERLFTEGGEVKAGQVLYQLDAATYQAIYDSAKADLARAEANQDMAKVKMNRHLELAKVKAVSQQETDEAIALQKQAAAEVAAATATLKKAQIDLAHTQVNAPISGQIGRSVVTAGALVTENQQAALAVVQQLDPIYVDLTQSSAEIARLRKEVAAGRLQRSEDAVVAVTLLLEDGSEYAHAGKLAFSETSVDEQTGSVVLRAEFPNPDHELLPGMYVQARVMQGSLEQVYLLPQAAVSLDPRGHAQVMLVNAEDKVESRQVQLGQARDGSWVVMKGLAAGDRVITEGLQRVRPGAAVQVADQASGDKPVQ